MTNTEKKPKENTHCNWQLTYIGSVRAQTSWNYYKTVIVSMVTKFLVLLVIGYCRVIMLCCYILCYNIIIYYVIGIAVGN